eukprot:COSAG02_NODE_6840_length_3333_cov_2.140074_3_plen_202_part_00
MQETLGHRAVLACGQPIRTVAGLRPKWHPRQCEGLGSVRIIVLPTTPLPWTVAHLPTSFLVVHVRTNVSAAVAARLKHFNVTMVMFHTDGSRTMDHFEDRYPFDEDGKHGGLPVASHKEFMRPHDVECDETPHADPRDNSTYDNAYCEVSQQIFNLGYRAVWPEVFMDKKGSKVSVSRGPAVCATTFHSAHRLRVLSVLAS